MEANRKFAEKQYWDNRFHDEKEYEWFGMSFLDLLPVLQKHDVPIDPSMSVLMLGTGNSSLPIEMVKFGKWSLVTAIDFSHVVLEMMNSRAKSMKHAGNIEWLTSDLRCMPFRSNTFDIVFEKGTLDVFFVGEKDPWSTSENTQAIMSIIIKQVTVFFNSIYQKYNSSSAFRFTICYQKTEFFCQSHLHNHIFGYLT